MNTTPELVELMFANLKGNGATPVEAIKAIHLKFGVPLGEAKRLFSLSPAWAKEVDSGDKLHNEVFTALGSDVTS